MGLYSYLVQQQKPTGLRTSDAQWKNFLSRVQRLEAHPAALDDEGVWTFLCGYGFTATGAGDALASALCGTTVPPSVGDVWLECEPLPPRVNEGNTMVDLAAGNLELRSRTVSGIQFDPTHAGPDSWVLLVECKWKSDMSGHTRYDPLRGQMLRVLENTMALQGASRFPESAFFTLLTPRVFKKNPRLRGYGSVFLQYLQAPALIVQDLDLHQQATRAPANGWTYPNLSQRLPALRLQWVDYETVIEAMPPSAFKNELLAVARRPGTLLQA